jgi:hypothetical protein
LDHLEEFDEKSNVSVEVGLSARIINLHSGEVLSRGTSMKTVKVGDRSVPGVVSEMSRGLGQRRRLLRGFHARAAFALDFVFKLNRAHPTRDAFQALLT